MYYYVVTCEHNAEAREYYQLLPSLRTHLQVSKKIILDAVLDFS